MGIPRLQRSHHFIPADLAGGVCSLEELHPLTLPADRALVQSGLVGQHHETEKLDSLLELPYSTFAVIEFQPHGRQVLHHLLPNPSQVFLVIMKATEVVHVSQVARRRLSKTCGMLPDDRPVLATPFAGTADGLPGPGRSPRPAPGRACPAALDMPQDAGSRKLSRGSRGSRSVSS